MAVLALDGEHVLSAIVGATAALTGFVVTVTVLVVQMATGTFSARYMRLWYRDRMLKAVLALLIGTLTFSFSLLRRVETDSVPNLGRDACAFLLLVGLLMFLVFLDRALHRLRPVAVAALVGGSPQGRLATEALGGRPDAPDVWRGASRRAASPHCVRRAAGPARSRPSTPRAGRLGARARLPPRPAPRGRRLRAHRARADRGLRRPSRGRSGSSADGRARRRADDRPGPGFAVRIMVDVAIRALSPAVNDPTTAVQVLDHLGRSCA